MTKFQSGFTLLEVLLAVSITALIGVGASQLLSSTAETKSVTEKRAAQLKEMQRADFLIRRDLTQIAGRDVSDSYGNALAAVLSDPTQTDYLMEITRSGLAPLPVFDEENIDEDASSSSNLQRIAYAVRGHDSDYCKDVPKPVFDDNDAYNKQCFVRIVWPVLDQTSDTEPMVQLLLEEVEEVDVLFRGQLIDFNDPNNTIRRDEWLEEWPGPYWTQNLTPDLVQLKMVITSKQMGEITRLYEVPRFAFTPQ